MIGLLSHRIAWSLVVVWAGLWAAPVGAEVGALPARTDVAGLRPQPEYAPMGLRLGAWTAAPEIGLNEGYDSNLFGLSQNTVGDGYLVLSPGLRLASDWSRHGVDLSARTALTRYVHHDRQNSDEYALGARVRLDLPEATTIVLSQNWDRTAERRGVNGIPLTFDRPSMYRASRQSIGIARDSGMLSLGLSISHQALSFSDLTRLDGSVESQGFRDSRSWTVEAGAGIVPVQNAALGLSVRYAHNDSPTVPERNSRTLGTQLVGTIDFGLFRTEGQIGYVDHRFSTPGFKDYRGLVFRNTTFWYPTTLMTVRMQLERALEASGDPAAGAVVATSVHADIDYELLRNLMLSGGVGRRTQRFRGTDRTDVSRDWGVKGEYSFNRSVAIGAYARHECRDSSGTIAQRQYCASLVGVTLKLRR